MHILNKQCKYTLISLLTLFLLSFSSDFNSCLWALSSSFSAGLTFVSVHDCFWTHALTVDTMNKVSRYSTVFFYSHLCRIFLPPFPVLIILSQLLASCLIICHWGFEFSSFCWWIEAKGGIVHVSQPIWSKLPLSLFFRTERIVVCFWKPWACFSTFTLDTGDRKNLCSIASSYVRGEKHQLCNVSKINFMFSLLRTFSGCWLQVAPSDRACCAE